MKKFPLLSSAFALSFMFATAAQATPHEGSKELRIGQEYLPPAAITNGIVRLEPDKGEGLTGMGLGAGMGWFVSNGTELGLSLSLDMIKQGGNTVTGPGVAPFIRFMFVSGRVGYFAELDASFQHFSSDSGGGVSFFAAGADLGLEFFVTEDWAIRVAPTFRHLIVSSSSSSDTGGSDDSGNRFGLTWGLACYF